MSYAKILKEEITGLKLSNKENLAEISALLNLNSEFLIQKEGMFIDFKTSNPTVARRFLSLIRQLYGCETEIITKKDDKFKRKYNLTVRVKTNIDQILSEHQLLDTKLSDRELLLFDDETKMAYLRGAFLASGSVNDPKRSEYHMEIFSSSANEVIFIQRMLNHFELNARITTRRNGLIIYLKDQESISYFIQLIGGNKAFLDFQDLVIHRDFNNSINRIINCEIANEKKIIENANQQLREIAVIEKNRGRVDLTDKLTKVIELRKENKTVSLKELVDLYEKKYNETITKSGLNHRFSRIKELAYEILSNK